MKRRALRSRSRSRIASRRLAHAPGAPALRGEVAQLVAADVMTRNPSTICERNTVRDAWKVLHDLDVRHLPVVNEDREPVGIVSDRDLRGAPGGEAGAGPDELIASIMTSDVMTVTTETSLKEIIGLMLDHKVGAIPVVNPEGALVGIVSYVDLLRGLEGEL